MKFKATDNYEGPNGEIWVKGDIYDLERRHFLAFLTNGVPLTLFRPQDEEATALHKEMTKRSKQEASTNDQ